MERERERERGEGGPSMLDPSSPWQPPPLPPPPSSSSIISSDSHRPSSTAHPQLPAISSPSPLLKNKSYATTAAKCNNQHSSYKQKLNTRTSDSDCCMHMGRAFLLLVFLAK
ncbi:unnamed protein product [Arctogadus glacialis]